MSDPIKYGCRLVKDANKAVRGVMKNLVAYRKIYQNNPTLEHRLAFLFCCYIKHKLLTGKTPPRVWMLRDWFIHISDDQMHLKIGFTDDYVVKHVMFPIAKLPIRPLRRPQTQAQAPAQ